VKSCRLNLLLAALAAALCACGSDSPSVDSPQDTTSISTEPLTSAACPAVNFGKRPAPLTLTAATPPALQVFGVGNETGRYTAEVAARGTTAYTTTWGARTAVGNKIDIWDVSGATPTLVDSVIVSGASTLGDVAVSDDGKLLVVATERSGGSIVIFDLTDPRHPRQISRFTNQETDPGVHTAEIGRVNGKLYAFLSIDPVGSIHAKLVIVDLSDPANPQQVYSKVAGNPYVHDTFVRDGLLFVALWDDGVEIWDIGGCGTGATPAAPRVLGNVHTVGGQVHNIWWFHDASGGKRFAFVGQEGPGSIGSSSAGDIHVVDISDPTAPKEVGFYHVDGAGTHNFSVDEANGVLYAAYYNGGVRAIDVRGDLKTCLPSQQNFTTGGNITRCDLRLMGREIGVGLVELNRGVYVWGVQYLGGTIYASDMVNGIWKLKAAK
jgi:hypothetical protein